MASAAEERMSGECQSAVCILVVSNLGGGSGRGGNSGNRGSYGGVSGGGGGGSQACSDGSSGSVNQSGIQSSGSAGYKSGSGDGTTVCLTQTTSSNQLCKRSFGRGPVSTPTGFPSA